MQNLKLVWGHAEEKCCYADVGLLSRVITLAVKAVIKEPLSAELTAGIACFGIH